MGFTCNPSGGEAGGEQYGCACWVPKRSKLGVPRFGAFDKAVSLWCENAFEEHGHTEDGKTVAPIPSRLFFQKYFRRSNAKIPSSFEIRAFHFGCLRSLG